MKKKNKYCFTELFLNNEILQIFMYVVLFIDHIYILCTIFLYVCRYITKLLLNGFIDFDEMFCERSKGR